MKLENIRKPRGIKKAKKRVGRGSGSGHGKTAGRGHKGAKSRSGAMRRFEFEGGQMSIIRRLPKRGFTSVAKEVYQVVGVDKLNHFRKDASVDKEALKKAGLIKQIERPVKVLGDGKIAKSLTVTADAFSKSAKKKIVEAGGKAEIAKKR